MKSVRVQVYVLVENQIYYQLGNQKNKKYQFLLDQAQDQVKDQVWKQVRKQVLDQIWIKVWNHVVNLTTWDNDLENLK